MKCVPKRFIVHITLFYHYSLKDEECKNQLLERDVDKFKNRQQFVADIEWINLKMLWLVRIDYNYFIL